MSALQGLKNAAANAVNPQQAGGAEVTRAEYDKVCDAWSKIGFLSRGEAGNWLRENHPDLHEAVRHAAVTGSRDVGWARYNQILQEK